MPMDNNQHYGLLIAIASNILTGVSFVVKKRGLQQMDRSYFSLVLHMLASSYAPTLLPSLGPRRCPT
jgi:hypothetical protein